MPSRRTLLAFSECSQNCKEFCAFVLSSTSTATSVIYIQITCDQLALQHRGSVVCLLVQIWIFSGNVCSYGFCILWPVTLWILWPTDVFQVVLSLFMPILFASWSSYCILFIFRLHGNNSGGCSNHEHQIRLTFSSSTYQCPGLTLCRWNQQYHRRLQPCVSSCSSFAISPSRLSSPGGRHSVQAVSRSGERSRLTNWDLSYGRVLLLQKELDQLQGRWEAQGGNEPLPISFAVMNGFVRLASKQEMFSKEAAEVAGAGLSGFLDLRIALHGTLVPQQFLPLTTNVWKHHA